MPKVKYGAHHQAVREWWRPYVEAGQTECCELICLMPSRVIKPGSAWDLAHGDSDDEYRGPAHARCNRSEGAKRRHAKPKRWVL